MIIAAPLAFRLTIAAPRASELSRAFRRFVVFVWGGSYVKLSRLCFLARHGSRGHLLACKPSKSGAIWQAQSWQRILIFVCEVAFLMFSTLYSLHSAFNILPCSIIPPHPCAMLSSEKSTPIFLFLPFSGNFFALAVWNRDGGYLVASPFAFCFRPHAFFLSFLTEPFVRPEFLFLNRVSSWANLRQTHWCPSVVTFRSLFRTKLLACPAVERIRR